MNVEETSLKGCFIIQPKVIQDERGYFLESFNQAVFKEEIKQDINFVQDNESYSSKGVLRGLHYQKGEYAQAKLVRVIKGKILDVVVDLRIDSPTFSKYISIELSEDNKTQLFIPRGFAHGFLVLSDTAIFSYKCDNFYNKSSEGGIIYNDPTLNIDWGTQAEAFIISEKDLILPTLKEVFK